MNYLNINYYAEGWMRDYYFYFYDDAPLDWDCGCVDKMILLGHFHNTFPIFDISSFIVNSVCYEDLRTLEAGDEIHKR